ncbi:MAG: HD domain-containing protein [Blautia sp.]|nr:HD domain-containing protein [Blautia sp.]
MKKTKKFRDPVYGYIEIDENIVHNIVDTATFQRLRNIRQTSYAPLYPSSLHNRFVHSLGVYHLGCLAFSAISQSLQENEEKGTRILGNLNSLCKDKFVRYKELFELACLLHDVGHSPFSHTGEEFYTKSKSQATFMSETEMKEYQKKIDETVDNKEKDELNRKFEEAQKYSIYKHLAYLTNDTVFKDTISSDSSPHEIMSCIIALESFGHNERYFQNDDERSFFARCITGIQYNDAIGLSSKDFMDMKDEQRDYIWEKMLLNCIIQLLHSTVIDVDRLDYIIRDASTMGYQSVSVDYTRLLSGLEIVLIDDYAFTIGFHKNAISVIENAVYAHDNEKKWVQSHPTILYDSFLLQQAIIYIEDKIKEDYPQAKATLFSYDSLTDKGSYFISSGADLSQLHIRYLGDADLIFLMKNRYSSSYSEEYFSRDKRRLPVWKSEAEFMNLFDEGERKTIINALEKVLTNTAGVVDSVEVNDETISAIHKDIEEAKGYSSRAEVFEKKLEYVNKLLDTCEKYGVERNVALLSKSFFKSNFSKETMRNLPMLFPGSKTKSILTEVSPTLFSEQIGEGKLVYLFYYPRKNREKINAYQFARDLLSSLEV